MPALNDKLERLGWKNKDWLSRIDKDNKEMRDAEIAKLHLACWTQEEIAAAVADHDVLSLRNLAVFRSALFSLEAEKGQNVD